MGVRKISPPITYTQAQSLTNAFPAETRACVIYGTCSIPHVTFDAGLRRKMRVDKGNPGSGGVKPTRGCKGPSRPFLLPLHICMKHPKQNSAPLALSPLQHTLFALHEHTSHTRTYIKIYTVYLAQKQKNARRNAQMSAYDCLPNTAVFKRIEL